jgi:hypothetical protein
MCRGEKGDIGDFMTGEPTSNLARGKAGEDSLGVVDDLFGRSFDE